MLWMGAFRGFLSVCQVLKLLQTCLKTDSVKAEYLLVSLCLVMPYVWLHLHNLYATRLVRSLARIDVCGRKLQDGSL